MPRRILRREGTEPVYQPETAAPSEPVSHVEPVNRAAPVSPIEGEPLVDTEPLVGTKPLVGTEATVAFEERAVDGKEARSAGDWVSQQLRREALERFVPPGSRVLELNAGAGQYTEVLHRLGCRVTVLDESLEQLDAHRAATHARGFEGSIESWAQRDLCALADVPDAAYDAVVAYGGALSFTLERRDRALSECIRVLRPRGVLVIDVLSLWGTLHRHLPFVLGRDLVVNRGIIRSGNACCDVFNGEPRSHGRQFHLFRAAELEAFLRRGGLDLLSLSASSALSTGLDMPAASDPSTRSALLEYERAACVERGYLDSGSHIIAVARR